MSIYSHHFPLGLGTNRFPVSSSDDGRGIEKSVELVKYALELGVDYIDTSYSYAKTQAHSIIRRAFEQTDKRAEVTVKVKSGLVKNADDTYNYVEQSLKELGIRRAAYFMCWCILSIGEFDDIMKPGGIYDGAKLLLRGGLVEHIVFSTHAPNSDIIRIIDSNAFEAMTISYSLLNAQNMNPVLDLAHSKGMGVAVMNPLAGGIIPQNKDFFRFAQMSEDDGVIPATLRFAKSHPAVDIVLAGPSTLEELQEDVAALTPQKSHTVSQEERHSRVLKAASSIEGYCSGCRYCDGCPQGIPISEIMQSRNTLIFNSANSEYSFASKTVRENIELFNRLGKEFSVMLDSGVSPCIECGQCEKNCTQRLKIIESITDTYKRAETVCCTRSARRERLDKLLNDKGYMKVAFWPGGWNSSYILNLYRENFGQHPFEIVYIDSNPERTGQKVDGIEIFPPEMIPQLEPDVILVCNFKYATDIAKNARKYETEKTKAVSLFENSDIPWVI